jgi:hypothetical protein
MAKTNTNNQYAMTAMAAVAVPMQMNQIFFLLAIIR